MQGQRKPGAQNSLGDLKGYEVAQAIHSHSVQRTTVLFPISCISYQIDGFPAKKAYLRQQGAENVQGLSPKMG